VPCRLNVEGDILTISVQKEEKQEEQKTANGVKCAPPRHPHSHPNAQCRLTCC